GGIGLLRHPNLLRAGLPPDPPAGGDPAMSTVHTYDARNGRDQSRPGRRRRGWAEVRWKYPVAVLIVFYAAFPLVYALSAALDKSGSLAGSTSLFARVSLTNFEALGDTMFWV